MQHLTGDLFARFSPGIMSDIAFDAIAHVCNCQGVMGSGIALSIKQRYPEAYIAYKQHEKIFHGLDLGTVSRATLEDGKQIYNLHAQEFYGKEKRHLNYEALYECLLHLRKSLIYTKKKVLGIPYKMGCDRAGGDWRIVESMMNAIFDDDLITVISVKL